VEQGEQILIARRGKLVARLMPIAEAQKVSAALARLRRLRQGTTLGHLDWRTCATPAADTDRFVADVSNTSTWCCQEMVAVGTRQAGRTGGRQRQEADRRDADTKNGTPEISDIPLTRSL
jgi:antitoxin (DNA-binding transcriptional repressor) of toxin-antitoxin stability system